MNLVMLLMKHMKLQYMSEVLVKMEPLEYHLFVH